MLSNSLAREAKRVLKKMEELEPTTTEYDKLLLNFEKLDKAKLEEEESEFKAGREDAKLKMAEEESKKNFFKKVDPNTWVSLASTIGSILLVGHFEEVKVLSQKMFSFVHKPKLK